MAANGARAVVLAAVVFGGITDAWAAEGKAPDCVKISKNVPDGVCEIRAPEPPEISGVAALANGRFAVVGDDTKAGYWIWPGSSNAEEARPFRPDDKEGNIKGPESIDVGYHSGQELWLVLSEDKGTLYDFEGGKWKFPLEFSEERGRGLEGLALRRHENIWQVAVTWEGGFYNSGGSAAPKLVVFNWEAGKGKFGNPSIYALQVEPGKGPYRFRATDLVWNGAKDEVIVLLGSNGKINGQQKYCCTWLQKYELPAQATRPNAGATGNLKPSETYRLEKHWGPYREGKNWEALDWTHDDPQRLVLGYDIPILELRRGDVPLSHRSHLLAIMDNPFP